MAPEIPDQNEEPDRMIIPGVNFDALRCTEEISENGELNQREPCIISNRNQNPFQISFNRDPIFEDEQIPYLLCKESDLKIKQPRSESFEPDSFISRARAEAVEWILEVSSYFDFSALTSLLAVNYIDRFISGNSDYWIDQNPWTPQLAALACLSLAAKMEEVEVPLLLDLQVKVKYAGNYIFGPKKVQDTEILILKTLQWRMNPVTPLSFMEYIMRSFGLKDHQCGEFLSRCEIAILSLVSDCKFMLYLPSVMAAASALHVVNRVTPSLTSECTYHLLGILKVDKEKLDERCELITEHELTSHWLSYTRRILGAVLGPGSPNDVMDVSSSSSPSLPSSSSSSSSSSPPSSPSSPSPSSSPSSPSPPSPPSPPSLSSSSSNYSSPEPKRRRTDDRDHDDAIFD